MENNNNTKTKKPLILLTVLIIFMAVGFALLSTSIGFTGTIGGFGHTWDLHFGDIIPLDENVLDIDEIEVNPENLSVNFGADLQSPGDVYGIDIEIVNDGTLDVMLDTYTLAGLTTDLLQYVDYEFKYENGDEIEQYDCIPAGSSEIVRFKVSYKSELTADDLPLGKLESPINISFSYLQADERAVIRHKGLYKIIKDGLTRHIDTDFTNPSPYVGNTPDNNGVGVNVLTSTEKNLNPIYFYRGNISNNNIIFGGFCWKMIRTTETGGVKVIYNGKPNDSGACDKTGSNTQLKTIVFGNVNKLSSAFYTIPSTEYSSNYISSINSNYYFASDVTWNGVKYILSEDGTTSNLNDIEVQQKYHYSCLNTGKECTSVYYMISTKGYTILYNGDTIESVMDSFEKDNNDSIIKREIDTWYLLNLKDYDNKIEDTVYCNDRRVDPSVFQKNYILPTNIIYDGGLALSTADPNTLLKCNKHDSYTVSETKGNGKLKYKVGLLQADEGKLAGLSSNSTTVSGNYLISGAAYYTMTPGSYAVQDSYYYAPTEYYVGTNGVLSQGNLTSANSSASQSGIRPVISLKSSARVMSGTGTTTDPYIVK